VAGTDGAHRFDHVVSVMFENRSFDNLLGHLYEPGEVASFEGAAGRELSNPIPSYAPEAERGVVPVHVATSMDAPNPDAGEEHPHTNTQLFGTVAPEDNRFLSYEKMQPPFNAPDDPGREPTMDGFVLDYVNTFRSEIGRLPGYDEYAQIMACYTPEQIPVISTIAKGFATFDHWFCEVPSQTFTNRSFYHAASSSGLVVNPPYDSFPQHNDAETIFERLDAAGLSWRVYVDPGMPFSLTGMIHTPRLSKQFATHFSTHDDFFADAEQGRLPTYSFIEPNLLHAHNDYHPAMNAIIPGLTADPPSSILGERSCWPASTRRSAAPPPRRGRTSPTPCSWSASTSTAAPTTTSRRHQSPRPTRPLRPDRWASVSTAPASGSPPWPSPPTSTHAPW
jgi:phospholipase C